MASKTKLEDLNLSRDEIKRLGEALKDEKFREMLREYAEEISDPENRRRYEEEIAEMERERGMDVTFIKPEPGYVLKTSVNGDKKAFINISKSDKLDKPNAERQKSKDGKSGLMWHIPHSFAPPREDYDKQKNRCLVYDFVVHPDTYRMAESNVRFKQMVEDTAMDGIERQFQVTLDRKNVKRPKIAFKGTPAATVIRHRNATGPKPGPDESGLLKDMPYPYDNKSTQEKMNELEEEKANKKRKDAASKNTSEGKEERKEGEATVPKYTIVHRSEVDMQEYRNAPDARPSTRPRELVIKIELPLLKAASQANLDIFEKHLLLESKTPAAYKLDLPLPYPVDDSEGSAKFDKQKRVLTVTLPVIPDKSPAIPSFINGTKEGSSGDMPLIEVLSNGTNEVSETPKENGISAESDDSANNVNGKEEGKTYKPSVAYTLPDFSFTQDAETVSFVLKVKNVSEDSVRRISPSASEMKLSFTSHGEGGFPLHFSLFLRFAESCQIANEHCSVDVTADNVVLLLLKERTSRGLWDRFWAGLDSDSLEERLFLTVSNLQQQLAELDEAAGAAEQIATSPEAAAVGAADCSPCDLEVTAMNDKKLTIKIAPPKRFGSSKREDQEDDEYDPPSSADIEVVHTRPSPNLHGILKQRTVSESSEDFSNDHDSPRSPEDEDELSSSFNSGWKRRSVSFSDHIDKATFKSSASVNSMKTALKSKRRRQRKWEEKTDKVSSRRRHNSAGSEGSGDDHMHSLSDSHSLSEDEEKGQGDQGETGKAVCAMVETALDFRTKPTKGKSSSLNEQDSSEAATSPSIKSRKNSDEENLRDSTKKAANTTDQGTDSVSNHRTSSAQSISAGNKMHPAETSSEDHYDVGNKETGIAQKATNDFEMIAAEGAELTAGPEMNKAGSSVDEDKKEEESLASKIKSKLAEPTPEDRPDDSDDDDGEQQGKATSSSQDPGHNEHRTVCAFSFSNEVMFDLDVE